MTKRKRKICPINEADCVGHLCAWWRGTRKLGECVVVGLALDMTEIYALVPTAHIFEKSRKAARVGLTKAEKAHKEKS